MLPSADVYHFLDPNFPAIGEQLSVCILYIPVCSSAVAASQVRSFLERRSCSHPAGANLQRIAADWPIVYGFENGVICAWSWGWVIAVMRLLNNFAGDILSWFHPLKFDNALLVDGVQ